MNFGMYYIVFTDDSHDNILVLVLWCHFDFADCKVIRRLAIIRDLEYNQNMITEAKAGLCYISAKEAARKWNISQRRVATLCSERRIAGAMMVGNMWIIPANAEKPIDKRTVRYEKTHRVELRPFVKWAGGKGRLVGEIEKILFSDNERVLTKYAEPMIGGGALFFDVLSKYDFKEYYIGDINSELINTYFAVQQDVENLIERLDALQTAFLLLDANDRKNYYYKIRDKFNASHLKDSPSIEKAAFFIFLNKTCFNGLYRVNRKNLFNVPMGTYKNPAIYDAANLRNIHIALKNVNIVCCDYAQSKSFIDNNTFVYLDPPYRPISETAAFTSYNSDTFDDKEQLRLAKFIDEINDMGAKIVLSNSDPKNIDPEDNFFDNLYKNYKINRVEASRAINSKGDKRGKINELLICN